MQRFHRLFGGEYSGSGCYIVVTAGREDSRGLGNPMTEPFPRRPRVLGSPRSVALAKEGVPPEWEPGCGAPRRRRPVGRERQPGATGHVTSGPGHRTRRGGAPRATGRAPAAGRDRPAGMEERPPRMRRRVPPVTWEPLTSPRPRTCAGASSGAAPSAHQSERFPRAVRVRLDAHRPIAVESAPRICGGRPKRSTSRMRFGPCLLPCGAPGAVPGRGRESRPGTRPGGRAARSRGRGREEVSASDPLLRSSAVPGEGTGGIAVRVWPTSYRPDRFAGVSQVVRG